MRVGAGDAVGPTVGDAGGAGTADGIVDDSGDARAIDAEGPGAGWAGCTAARTAITVVMAAAAAKATARRQREPDDRLVGVTGCSNLSTGPSLQGAPCRRGLPDDGMQGHVPFEPVTLQEHRRPRPRRPAVSGPKPERRPAVGLGDAAGREVLGQASSGIASVTPSATAARANPRSNVANSASMSRASQR